MSPEPSGTSVAVAFCPHPPALLPGLAGTPGVGTDRLRIACGDALQTVLGLRPDVVLVVGDGPAGVRYGAGDAADLAAWGGTGRLPFAGRSRPGGHPLPLAHAVGARLLDEAGHCGMRLGVAPGDLADALTQLPGPVGILAMGDARLPRAAPPSGDRDPAAGDGGAGSDGVGPPDAGFGVAVSAALAHGDAAALAALGTAAGEPVRAGAWVAVGAVLAGRSVTSRVLLDGTASGGGHLVADWVLAEVPDGVPGWLQP